ncbi:hypothetical protein JW796_04245 [Candidatus Dojkabacteria bacterium]|nr:hypothetical protein [Candidatus Dojkabacteria bacterium]
MEITPAILTDNLATFKAQMKAVEKFSDEVDIDILDGSMFEAKTLPAQDMLSVDTPLVRHLHIMVMKPKEIVNLAAAEGVRSIIFQAESDLTDINFNELTLESGIAIAPETPLASIEKYLNTISIIQILLVNPGGQGNVFMPEQLKKVDELRDLGYKGRVKVDGAVCKDNISEIEEYKVDAVSVGSAIWQSDDPTKSFRDLQRVIHNN